MPRRRRMVLPLLAVAVVLAAGSAAAASPAGDWPWPVVGPVIRGFEPPATPYGSGHRGIDIAIGLGTPIRAPAPGVVSFAGPVGGQLFVSVDHGGGLVTTYSWLSAIMVRKGDAVLEGTVLGLTGLGHPGSVIPHLHMGAKLDGTYIDPLSVLAEWSAVGLIRLAPVLPPGGT